MNEHYVRGDFHRIQQGGRRPPAPRSVRLVALGAILAAAVIGLVAERADAAVSKQEQGAWFLVVSSTPQYPSHATHELCQQARAARIEKDGATKTSGKTTYYCREGIVVTFAVNPPPPTETWTHCANQYQPCTFEGYKRVCFAASQAACSDAESANDFKRETYAPISCTSEAMGGNPAQQTPKFCYTSSASVTPPPPPPPPVTGSAKLTITPPTEHTDGSELTPDALAGFLIAHGDKVIQIPATQTTYTFENLPAGTHEFRVSTFKHTGAQSAYSEPVTKVIR